jgi:hypothetical protein
VHFINRVLLKMQRTTCSSSMTYVGQYYLHHLWVTRGTNMPMTRLVRPLCQMSVLTNHKRREVGCGRSEEDRISFSVSKTKTIQNILQY